MLDHDPTKSLKFPVAPFLSTTTPQAETPPAQPLDRPIRGVLLDTCNVLYDSTAWRLWVLKILHQLGVQTSYRAFFRVWDREYLGEVHRGQREFCHAFEEFLRSVGLSTGQIAELQAACEARRRDCERNTRALPGVSATVAMLHRAGLQLAAIGNSIQPASVIRQRLARFAMGPYFSAIVSSIDSGCTMPEPASYQAALAAMQLSAEEVAFVGHDAAQLAGAAALGMQTVAFDPDLDAAADREIEHFEDLLDVLAVRRSYAAAG